MLIKIDSLHLQTTIITMEIKISVDIVRYILMDGARMEQRTRVFLGRF